MKKAGKQAVAATLAAALAVGFSGCSMGQNSNDTSGGTNEVTTLSGFISFGYNQTAIDKATWFTDYLRDELGIELMFQDTAGVKGTQVMQTLLSGGELPDIVGFDDVSQMSAAAEAGLLLNLDDYKEQLPSIYENPLYESAVNYYRDNRSGGQGKLFLMPSQVGVQDSINFDPQLRWDIYEKIGSPEISTMEDYLDVLKQMQDAYPQTEDGQKVYGLSIFSEWDNYTMSIASYMASLYGVDAEYVNAMCETPADGSGQPESILRDDSIYKRMLKFFYDANQMGILDPDSVTQKWETVSEKYNNGQILFSPWAWAVEGYNTLEHTDADEFSGYASVWAEDLQVPIRADAQVGTNWCLGISASTENVDAALKFLNFLYSYEGQDLLVNGPEGVLWEKGEDGLRVITDEGWDILENGKEMPGGGKVTDASDIINVPTITPYTINPATDGQTMSYLYWDSSILHKNNKLLTDWRASHGDAVNTLAWAKQEGLTLKCTSALNMMPAMPDDLLNTMAQIGDVVKTNSWKMIFAADEAEFESLWKDMQQKAETLGMQQIVEWAQENFETAKQQAEQYQ